MRENSGIIEDLCAFSDVLFSSVNVEQVLSGSIYFDSISCPYAADLLFKKQERYRSCSRLECAHIADSLSSYICERDGLRMRTSKQGTIHVFELLSDLADRLLLQENGEVLCRYTHILNWRRLVQSIGEELPVTAMYAIKDMEYGRPPCTHFTWDFVVRQNNEPLNQLMRRGISEHHMHLWASVPYYQVSWLNLMNKPAFSPYVQNFDRINREDWSLEQSWLLENGPDETSSLVLMYQKAALIRLYLCARLKGWSLRDWESEKDKPRIRVRRAEEVEEERRKERAYVLRLLQEPQQLWLEMGRIQSWISALRELSGAPCIDYALHLFSNYGSSAQEEYQVFSGERWFLYSTLQDIYKTHSVLDRKEQNLFYAYLLLQVQIRARMVQADDKVGFDHFQKIQRRKSYFLGNPQEMKMIMDLAVRTPLRKTPHLLEMEARIVPRDTPEELHADIAQLERAGCGDWDASSGETEPDALEKRHYYVFSFTKESDRDVSSDFGRYRFEYRHYSFRKRLEKKGWAVRAFRERFPTLACKVRGIDACSQEIGCRPENFAFLFRMLSNHTCEPDAFMQLPRPPRLRKTYHVGEDFLDLVDGLRAIDEAIHFLNLNCGDRLGHALALSIEPKSWYDQKNGQVSLQKQDYLDNVAWLCYVIRRYQIPNMEAANLFLKAQFEYYFRQVYLNHIDEKDTELLVKSGEVHYQGKPYARNYRAHKLSFSIEDYCRAWMLRGDHPELYELGYFWEDALLPDGWSQFKVNTAYPVDPSVRYIPECSFLNFCYHYNGDIRKTGEEYITVAIDEEYLKSAVAVQRALQFDVANRGLSVECNPTSNVKISTFRSYEQHPITKLYNKELVHSGEELRQCPQVSVSLNTDDSGVFFTSLESEYAVVARALETLQKDGRPLYYKWEIYDWLDRIREMGNAQSMQGEQSGCVP